MFRLSSYDHEASFSYTFASSHTPLFYTPAFLPTLYLPALVVIAPQRIRAGKEMLEAKRKEEDGAMRRLVEERKREKEEEARAR